MILEAQQIERVESENRASPVEARERLAARRDELTSRLREALEATVFSNRFLLPPRRLPQIARAEADAFLDFLKTGDADRIREQGAKRAEEGLGEQAMLRLGTTLRQFCRDYPADETLRAADVYTNALLEGFMEGREAIVLEEQEQIRKALQGVISRYALQLTTAAEVSRAASSILDLAELLPEVVNLIRDRFNFYYVGLFLLDASGEYAVLRAGTGEAGRQMLEMGHKLEVGGTSMIGWCTAHSKARIALDVGKEAVRFDNPLLPETRSEMALPLISRGRVIGAMTIQSDKPAAFSEEDIAALQTMADQLANAIENARLFEEEQAQRRLADNLLEITRTVGSTLDLEEVLNLILEQLGQVVDYDSTAILLVEGDELRATALRGFKDEEKKQFTFPWKEMEHLRHPLETKEPLVIADTRQQPSWRDELGTTHIRSWIGVPLVSKGKAIGLLTIDSAKLNHFSQREAQLAALFAGQVATAIEN
ncbi:MAG TPA: GAF domain-containing protein, partial [Anaerolineae bacterium]|nr:GAF domain-containing protein [Anaerolineae bacterium]